MKKQIVYILFIILSILPCGYILAQTQTLYDFEQDDIAWLTLLPDGKEEKCTTSSISYSGIKSLSVRFNNQVITRILVRPNADWSKYSRISFMVYASQSIKTPIEAVAYFKDVDYWWYQKLLKQHTRSDGWTEFIVNLVPPQSIFAAVENNKYRWQSLGHNRPWNPYCLLRIREFGIILFSKQPVSGEVLIDDIAGHISPNESAATTITNFRVELRIVPCFSKFEARFNLSRAYSNPYDSGIVDITAIIKSPLGKEHKVNGFFMQDYRRCKINGFQKLVPESEPYWAIRYAPAEAGKYSYTIEIKDAFGVFTTSPFSFESVKSGSKGFVQVSETDGRWFEFSNGEFFYPIGHSVHAPVDEHYHRMQKLPLPAPDYRTFYYDGIFKKMADNSENITELWMCPWFLELEWTEKWGGYAGLGRYNMERAWETDYLVNLAEKYGIYLQIALMNHGEVSEIVDVDWTTSPYNINNGGFLKSTVNFFTDEKAIMHHKNKLRYIIARWGYSTGIFGWELISESDLVGTNIDFSRTPQVVSWMKTMSEYIKSIDYAGHPITNHYFGDYSRGVAAVFNLPSIGYVACDAYCNGSDFIELVYDTGQYDAKYGKPILITEYGIEWCGGPDNLMKAQLHAGMWAGWMAGISGTPMFWWHIFIDDYDQYFNFKAFAKFTQGEDRRAEKMDTAFVPVKATHATPESFHCLARKGSNKAYLWIYNERSCPKTSYYENIKYFESKTKIIEEEWCFLPVEGLIISLTGMDPIEYRIEVWDTYEGKMLDEKTLPAEPSGILTIPLPPIARDAAVKIKPIQSSRQ
jgi:hypothetical protein